VVELLREAKGTEVSKRLRQWRLKVLVAHRRLRTGLELTNPSRSNMRPRSEIELLPGLAT